MSLPVSAGVDAEVIVVGAGPAGSCAATFLAERGRDVLLLDRCRFPRDKPCGEFVNPAGAAILRGLGILEALPGHSWRPLGGLLLRGPDDEAVTLEYPGDPPPVALSLRRTDLDAALVRRAVAGGARFRPECRAVDLLRERGRVVGVCCRTGRGLCELRAPVVIAAVGAHSGLGERIQRRGEGGERRFGLVGHFRGVSSRLDQVEMHGLGWGYCGFALTGAEEATVAMVVREAELPRMQGRTAAFFAERLSQFGPIHDRVRDAEPFSPPLVTGPVGVRARWAARPGLLLAGDAAGFFDPFTGRGITRALRAGRDAAIAADTLLSGHPPAAVFRRYEAQRRHIDAAWIVERLIRYCVDRPPLLRYAVRRFQDDPGLGRLLLGVAGDLLPPSAVLNAEYLRRLIAARPATWARGASSSAGPP